MKHDFSEQIRDAGYEALFLLGGFLAITVQPTPRNTERVCQWIAESQARRQQLKRLAGRGLIEPPNGVESGQDQWVTRLTALGHAAFAGGRHPEPAWDRNWDGRWRLLTFDLPREQSELRMKLRRWMCANHFGRLQGSVWISPDPVPSLAEIMNEDQIAASKFLVFEGELTGSQEPHEVARISWDFPSINTSYRRYIEITARTKDALRGKTPSMAQLRKTLREDRKRWWEAVRRDPLLPNQLHPTKYEGVTAWKERCALLKKLGKTFGAAMAES